MLLENTKKKKRMNGRCHFYLELENIKINHKLYVPLCYIA